MTKTLTPRLVFKLWIALIGLVLTMAMSFILITNYYSNQHHLATQQEINAPLAQHIINEKFAQSQPYLDDGTVNKAFFGDLMHDMMAVNRSIEVYMLSNEGEVMYSVILDHDPAQPANYVNLEPVKDFIASDGNHFCLGDDPRNPEKKNIFSAAAFESAGKSGYMYIILSGEAYQATSANIFNAYIKSFGMGAIALMTLFILLLGALAIWFLTKNLRTITLVARRFKDGDLDARIEQPDHSDVAIFAHTFNEMADTINHNLEEIRNVDELRRNLIANVSHDLRTPLAILKGYAETLLEKTGCVSDPESIKYLEIINSNSDKLSKLVEQLFEYSKLEAKQIQPFMEPFSITDLCLDLVSKYQIIANDKNINLQLKVENKANIMVLADISLMERALQNLMDNALKFTPQNGSITVELHKKEGACQVRINDSGIGIDKDMQVTIFERFKQTDEGLAKNGAGLGLAIVRKIVELHDSTIRVMSKKDQGSTFIFELPLAMV